MHALASYDTINDYIPLRVPVDASCYCPLSQTGKDELEEESTGNKLKGMEVELTALEKDVRRYKERQEKQDKVRMRAGLVFHAV